MKIFSLIYRHVIFIVSLILLWGVLLLSLLMMGGFVRVNTWGNFNCGFGIWESNISFDRLKLMIVFIIFEMEVFVIVMVLSYIIVFILVMVTVLELIILYL